MAQLSRPYQLGLLAVALLAAVWLVLLQGHGGSSSPGSSSPPAAATATSHPAASGAHNSSPGGSTIYKGSAPGVQGLTRDVAKAKGAVTTSQQNARQLEQKSAQASSATASGAVSSAAASAPSTASSVPATKAAEPAKAKSTPAHRAAGRNATVVRQRGVEAQLARGKTVLILFWDAKGADDVATRAAVVQVRSQRGSGVAVQEASAKEVASFGTITRGVQVYGTPTLLIVTKSGKVRTLTGLQDAYAIQQAIAEARRA